MDCLLSFVLFAQFEEGCVTQFLWQYERKSLNQSTDIQHKYTTKHQEKEG